MVIKSNRDKVLVRLKEKSDLNGVQLTGVVLYSTRCSDVSIVDFEQVNARRGVS